ncbi:hypothetical protein DM01DRAFT_1334331 [Hesseltinella vesiculosa]|uniref:Grh/CP2 DB domain-containing protein n=1 Tax=Hesseltinella vesiculosa TaxID=101127 RepID=A0A1X2GLX2_9FUNG|nr:hypothetical protein DM01DRAFT_1334331 [Hesseltinella vesiculosa]
MAFTIKNSAKNGNSTSASNRVEVILDAPTAAAQVDGEAPLTYLNKGQYYTLSLKDKTNTDASITSTVVIMFHDENYRKVASNYWKFWRTQQDNPQQARAIDIESSKSSGVDDIEFQYFDRIAFKWRGAVGANIVIRFNCLSTDFSRIKGVKGIPLRLYTESVASDRVEKGYCRIKLFRDKNVRTKMMQSISRDSWKS